LCRKYASNVCFVFSRLVFLRSKNKRRIFSSASESNNCSEDYLRGIKKWLLGRGGFLHSLRIKESHSHSFERRWYKYTCETEVWDLGKIRRRPKRAATPCKCSEILVCSYMQIMSVHTKDASYN
jgi:hypothetical protein